MIIAIKPMLLNLQAREKTSREKLKPLRLIPSPRRTQARLNAIITRSITLRSSELTTLEKSVESLKLIKKIKELSMSIPLNRLNKLKRKLLSQ